LLRQVGHAATAFYPAAVACIVVCTDDNVGAVHEPGSQQTDRPLGARGDDQGPTAARDFAGRLGTKADLVRHPVYGHPSATLKQATAGSKPIFFDNVAGFER